MRTNTLILWVVIGLFAWAIYADYSVEIARYFTDGAASNVALSGSWGDTFGPFSAFISTAGFVAVLITLRVQRQAIQDQANDLHRQRFESTFFELLRLMRELRSEVTYSHSRQFSEARSNRISSPIGSLAQASLLPAKLSNTDAITAAVQEIHFWLAEEGLTKSASKDDLVEIYMKRIHVRSEATLGPYFRVIYTLLMRLRAANSPALRLYC